MRKQQSQTIYLLPEIERNGNDFSIFAGARAVSNRPVEVNNFSIFTFINRLDQTGFPFYAVTTIAPNKKAYLYPHTFPLGIPDFKSLDMLETPTEKGIVVHLMLAVFDALDEKDRAVKVKGGDWMKVSLLYHQIAVLNHLGIISEVSGPVFSMVSSVNRWTEALHQSFGTNGTLSDALMIIYERTKFAAQIFDISQVNQFLENFSKNNNNNNNNLTDPNSQKYCFGAMALVLQDSPELESMRHILPIAQWGSASSQFYILNQILSIVCDALNKNGGNINGLDDHDGFKKALTNFQRNNNLPVGACDLETLKKLSYLSNFKIVERLPIFSIAGIDVSYDQIIDFPSMKPLDNDTNSADQKPSIADRIRKEINKSIASTADPRAKIEWMNEKLIECVKESDDRCNGLALKIGEIEKKVTIMTGMLKDVIQESQSATTRVKIACRTLNNVYDAHIKIQGKFEVLRDRFSEQKNTRIILLIGILFSFFGALELFRR